MSIEKAGGNLEVTLEGLEEMKAHLMGAYEAFDAAHTAARHIRTGFEELTPTAQAAANNFTSAIGIVSNTVLPEFRAADTHFRKSGIRTVAEGSAHNATIAFDTASANLQEFIQTSDAAGAIAEKHMAPAINSALAANQAAETAADNPLSGADNLSDIVRRVDHSIEMITSYREML